MPEEIPVAIRFERDFFALYSTFAEKNRRRQEETIAARMTFEHHCAEMERQHEAQATAQQDAQLLFEQSLAEIQAEA